MPGYMAVFSTIIVQWRAAVLAAALIQSLSWQPVMATPEPHPSSIVSKQLELGMALLQQNSSPDNLVISPYSIHAGLTLARVGAVGATASALDKALFSAPYSAQTLAEYAQLNTAVVAATDTATTTLANSVWISNKGSFTAKFLADTSRSFKAEPRTIDFEHSEHARNTINQWVSNKTKALIPHLLPPGMPRPQTSATLVNALYFKAAWDTAFGKDLTKDGDFWISNGTTITAPMMHQNSFMPYFENDTWQAVQLSYARGTYSYLLLIPRSRKSVGEVVRHLSPELVRTALSSSTRTRVKLTMPRYKIRQSCELVNAMRSLGTEAPFSSHADYSGMTNLPVTIGAVIHEAVVLVDELGTEAAAATAVTMEKMALFVKDEPKEVTADRPFAFAIIHTTSQAPLFIGIVGDPRK